MIFKPQLSYEMLCKTGCGLCPHLMHKHGISMCLASGSILEEKPVYSRNFDGEWVKNSTSPVPSDTCIFKE